jgi:hypothetical protein
MYLGYKLAAFKMTPVTDASKALGNAIGAARGTEDLSFAQQLGKMFAVNMPQVEPKLVADTALLWKNFWLFPAMIAGGIAVLFLLAFWDRAVKNDE